MTTNQLNRLTPELKDLIGHSFPYFEEQPPQTQRRIIEVANNAYTLGSEGKLFSAFIKSLLDSGGYTITELRAKDPALLKEVFDYWVNELPDYELPQPQSK